MDNLEEYEIQSIINNIVRGIQLLSNALKAVQNWWQEHADIVIAYISAFAEFGVWCVAVEKLKKRQIIFTDDLTPELAKQIYDAKDVDAVVQDYFFGNDNQNVNALINRCSRSNQVVSYKGFFSEIISAYEMEHYHLACVGLFSLLDGVLANASNMVEQTGFKKRICAITEKISSKTELSDIDRRLLCIYTSVDSFNDSIFFNSDFSEIEPELLNRHWAVHGRSHRTYTKFDFLRELLWLEGIIILADTNKRSDTKEME